MMEKLNFTKNWTKVSPSPDFPTVEPSETQVRADMQLLHDETRAAFNQLIDDLEDGAADDIGVDVPGLTADNLTDALIEIKGKLHTVTVSGTTLIIS